MPLALPPTGDPLLNCDITPLCFLCFAGHKKNRAGGLASNIPQRERKSKAEIPKLALMNGGSSQRDLCQQPVILLHRTFQPGISGISTESAPISI